MVSPTFFKINSLKSFFHKTFLTSFQNDNFLKQLRYDPKIYDAEMFKTDVPPMKKTHQVFICIQVLKHEKATLKARKVTKLHYRDLTSSNDEFASYAQSIKLIFTPSTTHSVNNKLLDLYFEGATLPKNFHEGGPTTTKLTFVALPSLTSHSTFYKCSRGIPCQPQDSPHSPLTRLGVIISYSLCLERKITLPSTSIIRWNITMESTPEKLIYSTSRNSTTFQVGILSSISLIKST